MYSGLYFRLMKALELQQPSISTKMISQMLQCIDEKCELGIYNEDYGNSPNAHDMYMALQQVQWPSNSMKLKHRIYEFYQDITLLSFKYSCMQDRLEEPRKEKNRQRRRRQKERKNKNRNGLRRHPEIKPFPGIPTAPSPSVLPLPRFESPLPLCPPSPMPPRRIAFCNVVITEETVQAMKPAEMEPLLPTHETPAMPTQFQPVSRGSSQATATGFFPVVSQAFNQVVSGLASIARSPQRVSAVVRESEQIAAISAVKAIRDPHDSAHSHQAPAAAPAPAPASNDAAAVDTVAATEAAADEKKAAASQVATSANRDPPEYKQRDFDHILNNLTRPVNRRWNPEQQQYLETEALRRRNQTRLVDSDLQAITRNEEQQEEVAAKPRNQEVRGALPKDSDHAVSFGSDLPVNQLFGSSMLTPDQILQEFRAAMNQMSAQHAADMKKMWDYVENRDRDPQDPISSASMLRHPNVMAAPDPGPPRTISVRRARASPEREAKPVTPRRATIEASGAFHQQPSRVEESQTDQQRNYLRAAQAAAASQAQTAKPPLKSTGATQGQQQAQQAAADQSHHTSKAITYPSFHKLTKTASSVSPERLAVIAEGAEMVEVAMAATVEAEMEAAAMAEVAAVAALLHPLQVHQQLHPILQLLEIARKKGLQQISGWP
jgi:hypothetical protein